MSKLETNTIDTISGSTNLTLGGTNATDITIPAGVTTTLTDGVSGDFKMNSGFGSIATAYGCRAWVNFDGTGTVAIRDSGNVSSITDNGTGDYTVNFTTNMPDTNYCVVASGGQNTTYANNVTRTVSALQNVQSGYPSSISGGRTLNDAPNYGVAIFR